MKIQLICVSAALFALININYAFAASTDWKSLEPFDFINKANEEADSYTSNVKIKTSNAVLFYKKAGDKKYYAYYGSTQSSTNYKTSGNVLGIKSSSTISYQTGTKKPKELYIMEVITNGTDIYSKPKGLKIDELNNKWIKSNKSQYYEFGYEFGVPQLYYVLDTSTLDGTKKVNPVQSGVMNKPNLWKKYNKKIGDGQSVKNATRYNFQLNSEAILPYLEEILEKDSFIRSKGVIYSDVNNMLSAFYEEGDAKFLAEKSYLSIWIDNKTGKPVRYTQAIWSPVTENKKTTYVQHFREYNISDYDKNPDLKIPTNSVSAEAAAKELDMQI